MTSSAIYDGLVAHQRLRPIRHRLRYKVFMLLLDLDELPAVSRSLKLFSYGRFNVFSFHDADHGEGGGNLRAWIEAQLRMAGMEADGGAIKILCMPRILGHAFNPISLFFCHRCDGSLAAMLYEVNNTFGERHSYLMPVRDAADPIRQSCEKQFYVSPFMPMDLTYSFQVSRPGERVTVAIDAAGAEGKMIATSFAGVRSKLTDMGLLKNFLRMPVLGLKVLAGIHWEAAKLLVRGLRLKDRPAPPEIPVTVTL
jgi:DUF1365 family protein